MAEVTQANYCYTFQERRNRVPLRSTGRRQERRTESRRGRLRSGGTPRIRRDHGPLSHQHVRHEPGRKPGQGRIRPPLVRNVRPIDTTPIALI